MRKMNQEHEIHVRHLKPKQLIANEQHVALNHNFGDLAAHLVEN